ncbi:MAG: aldehyde dehydrogenase family protein [Planctomycetota bacterium]|jgi:acyl-CoA reductase-like NAD-dependent aldehyde dehydrogenase|nr:aldehyde dehydrogenase family protein [Planctomycetota bacterium]
MDSDLKALQDVRDLLGAARAAQKEYLHFNQSQVDRVCESVVQAGLDHARYLAELAAEETQLGVAESKVLKNEFSVRDAWEDFKDLKTVGIIKSEPENGYHEIAEPFGVVAAVIPMTNPTSTALFKILISLKTRNAIVVSPHPRSVRCIAESCRIAQEAAVRAGAPQGLIQWMTQVTIEATQHLMGHEWTDLIVATGGEGLVHAAYSAGNPAYGVGPGNVSVYIHRSADVPHAAAAIVTSQTFDNATICCSEQSLVCDQSRSQEFLSELKRHKAHVTSPEETTMLERVCVRGRMMNPEIVGKFPAFIARKAGFSIPEDTTVLIVPYQGVGPKYPLSCEILTPLLTYYEADNEQQAEELCLEILRFGGLGHTFGIHATDEELIRSWAFKMPVNRYLVNAPTTQGGIGFSVKMEPSMTLGCGSFGKNISGDNITARHLMCIKKFCYIKPEFDQKYIQPRLQGTSTSPTPSAQPNPELHAGAPRPVLAPVRPYLMDKHNRRRL